MPPAGLYLRGKIRPWGTPGDRPSSAISTASPSSSMATRICRASCRSSSCRTITAATPKHIIPAADISEQISPGRDGGLRHRQHEADAQRRCDPGHDGRRECRDRRAGGAGEQLHLRRDRRKDQRHPRHLLGPEHLRRQPPHPPGGGHPGQRHRADRPGADRSSTPRCWTAPAGTAPTTTSCCWTSRITAMPACAPFTTPPIGCALAARAC